MLRLPAVHAAQTATAEGENRSRSHVIAAEPVEAFLVISDLRLPASDIYFRVDVHAVQMATAEAENRK